MHRIARAVTVAACCALLATACGSQKQQPRTSAKVASASPVQEKPTPVRTPVVESDLLTTDDLASSLIVKGFRSDPSKDSDGDDKLDCPALDAMNRTYDGEVRGSWTNGDVKVSEQLTDDPDAARDFKALTKAPCTHWDVGNTVLQVDPVKLSYSPAIGMTATFWTVGDIQALVATKGDRTVLLVVVGYLVDGSSDRLLSAALAHL